MSTEIGGLEGHQVNRYSNACKEEEMWADGGKDDRHEFGRSVNKGELFQ